MYEDLYELIEETLADFDIEDPILTDLLASRIAEKYEDDAEEEYFTEEEIDDN